MSSATIKVPSWDTVIIGPTKVGDEFIRGLESIEDKLCSTAPGRELINVVQCCTGRGGLDSASSDEVELACIGGSDYDSPPCSDEDEEAEGEGSKKGSKKGSRQSKRHLPTTISGLSKEANQLALDKTMFSTLKQLITGPFNSFLTISKRRRFTIGMIVLWDKAAPTSVSSKKLALENSVALQEFDGDSQKLKMMAVSARTQLHKAQVSIDEMLLMQFAHAVPHPTIKFDVINDIANGALDHTSFYDLVSKYTDAMGGVDGVSTASANYTQPTAAPSDACTRCGREGHTKDGCFANKHASGTVLDTSTKTANGRRLGQEHAKKLDERSRNNQNRTRGNNSRLSQGPQNNRFGGNSASATKDLESFKNLDADDKFEFLLEQQYIMMSSMDNKPDGNYVLKLLCNLHEIYKGCYPKTEIRCILDSGAGVNLSKYATHLNTESRIMVAGFNGSTETTKGVGDLPCTFVDALNGGTFAFTFARVHNHNGVKTLISLGLLLRAGFTLEIKSVDNILLFTPGRKHAISVSLGSDNIFYFACSLSNAATMHECVHECSRSPSACTAKLAQGRATHHRAERPYCPMGGACCAGTPESTSVPPRLARVGGGNCQHARKACLACDSGEPNGFPMVMHWCPDGSPMVVHYANKRTIQEASYSTLHSIFNHCGFVKLQHTLEHICGLTLPADGIKDCFCETCAMARAKRKGLSRKVSVNPAVPVGLDVFDVSFDHDDDLYLPSGPDYVVDSPGESFSTDGFINRGHDLHRFDVSKLRPFEVMYCDNFDYPCPVRGGKLTGFVMVCLKTFAIFKVDVKSKAHNGRAFRKLVSDEGIHKLNYKCTIYADNCGSMVHVS